MSELVAWHTSIERFFQNFLSIFYFFYFRFVTVDVEISYMRLIRRISSTLEEKGEKKNPRREIGYPRYFASRTQMVTCVLHLIK